MKQPFFFLLLFFAFWQLTINPAAAQDPYHCDTLKVTCFDEAKINVRFFNAPKTCPEACSFCKAIQQED